MRHLSKITFRHTTTIMVAQVLLAWSLFISAPASATDATDFGWKGLGLNKGVFSLAFDPNDANTIYAGTHDSGLYRSSDAGESWEHLWGDNGAQVRAIVIGKESKTIFLGVALGPEPGIWTSTDNGATWTKIDTGLGVRYIQALVMHPTNEQVLYAGTGWGVVKTEDGGQTWIHASEGLMGDSGDFPWVHEITIDSINPEILYALTNTAMLHRPVHPSKITTQSQNQSGPPIHTSISAYVSPNIYKTQNSGISWQPIESNIDSTQFYVPLALSVNPVIPNVLYIGTTQGLMKTTDGGTTLIQVDLDFPKKDWTFDILYDPLKSTVFAGTRSTGLFSSIDQGENWKQIYSFGLREETSGVFALLVYPSEPKRIYVGGPYARDLYTKFFFEKQDAEDFNEDGRIDFDDFLLFAKHFNLNVDTVVLEKRFDLNENGKIDFSDFLMFVKGF